MATLLVLYLLLHISFGDEIDVIKSLTMSVGDIVIECHEEMNFEHEVMADFLDFWNDQNELRSKDMGCVLMCVFNKLEAVDEHGDVIPANVEAYFKALGADDPTIDKMSKLAQLCQRATQDIPVKCEFALEVTKCIRYGIFQLHWAPEVTKHKPSTEPQKKDLETIRNERFKMRERVVMKLNDKRDIVQPSRRRRQRVNKKF